MSVRFTRVIRDRRGLFLVDDCNNVYKHTTEVVYICLSCLCPVLAKPQAPHSPKNVRGKGLLPLSLLPICLSKYQSPSRTLRSVLEVGCLRAFDLGVAFFLENASIT